jgi:hypothetical protein
VNDWAQVVLDFPGDRPAVAFWAGVLGAELGPPWSGHPELRTFEPAVGDGYVHAQEVEERARVHVDFEVDDVAVETARLAALGALPVRTTDVWQTLRSPGGLLFCLVARTPHGDRPEPVGPIGRRIRLVQICIDAPAALADREADFWRTATGWRFRPSDDGFIGKLFPAPGSPIQLLLQRLGPEDDGVAVRAHIDLGCDDLDAAAELMVSLGAERLWDGDGWITLRDPAGMTFCVTRNSPDAP